jgi:UDP-N-acetylglucosamine transferase subunit ALG13
MIFVTVGTQLPFDRLVKAVDSWAGQNRSVDVFGQIGPTQYEPQHMQYSEFVDAVDFREKVGQADLVVAHAGMGSIITALELGKPILVMPRRGDLGEHRNEHQMATAKRFLEQGRIHVAFDEEALVENLRQIELLKVKVGLGVDAAPELIEAIRTFILEVA